jgi:hypothetical protein
MGGNWVKVAAIFPVGTSVGGAPEAITEILSQEHALDVHLLYGEPGNQPRGPKPQTFSDPKEAVEAIRREVKDSRIRWGQSRMVHSFEFARTYEEIRKFISEIGDKYDRVYIGITGGTNPMNSSLFQTSMAYLRAEVKPVYVQAHENVWQKNFVASEIRDRVLAEEALATARSGQVRVAARLGERLPDVGKWKFLRESLTALSHWDDFDYGQASQRLEHLARKCTEYAEDDLLGHISNTIGRIGPNARRMNRFTTQLRDPQSFDAQATAGGWIISVEENGLLLVADALANANRRMQERRYTDSVLRCYRAAECATQMRLFKLGIHPSKPNACSTAYQRYGAAIQGGERPLGFDDGLKVLQSAGELDRASIEGCVRDLQKARNETYLEHGYVRVQREQSQNCFNKSLTICEALLGPTIQQKWREFEILL